MKTVAIVGGGFSGTSLAAMLACRSETPLQILLFDRTASFGKGVAYGTTDPHHWLNVPSAAMSAFEDQPDHFVEWLRAHGGEEEEGFAARADYGRYLTSLLAVAPKHPETRLRAVGEEVIALRDAFCLQTAAGHRFAADAVVLATGYLRKRVREQGAVGPYASETWPQSGVRNAVILGSGLSALDAAMTLFDRYPGVQIVCVSRHGLFPQPFQEAKGTYRLSASFPTGSVREFLRWLRGEIARAERQGAGWTHVFDAMRPHWETVWQSLDLRERRRFRSHLARRFECFRHRVPPPLAHRLAPYLASGALTVRIRGQERDLSADLVIDASGPEWRWGEGHEVLYRDLLETGRVQEGPLGWGLRADDLGRVGTGLYAVGPMLRGERWETTAVRELRRQVQVVALSLLNGL